jgi:DNA processing protein
LDRLAGVLKGRRPSEFYSEIPEKTINDIGAFLDRVGAKKYNVLIRDMVDYPKELQALGLPLLYFLGDLTLLYSRRVSVVGSRKATPSGLAAVASIAKKLTVEGFTVVSGLAMGVDTAAHQEAINHGHTVAVIGTPINQTYHKQNTELQKLIAINHLLLSHVPFFKYSQQNYKINRGFFPERNKVMAALSEATVIVEASDTSGALVQARECIRLDKKLFILKPTFDNQNLAWPKRYVSNDAIVVEKPSEIIKALQD